MHPNLYYISLKFWKRKAKRHLPASCIALVWKLINHIPPEMENHGLKINFSLGIDHDICAFFGSTVRVFAAHHKKPYQLHKKNFVVKGRNWYNVEMKFWYGMKFVFDMSRRFYDPWYGSLYKLCKPEVSIIIYTKANWILDKFYYLPIH